MYREAEFEEPCGECGQAATRRCARCGDPCCDRHVYSDDDTCAECESEFLKISSREDGPGAKVGLVAGGGITAIGILAMFGANVMTGMLAGIWIGGLGALGHLGGKRRRKRYLAERRKLFLAESTARRAPVKG